MTHADTKLPVPLRYTERLRDMKNGSTLLFKDAKPNTIQALCVRMRKKNKQEYVTRVQNGGVRVWRVK